jgi:hypothetical protein
MRWPWAGEPAFEDLGGGFARDGETRFSGRRMVMGTVLGFVPLPAEVSGPPRFVPVSLQHSVVVVGLHLAVEVSGIAVTRVSERGQALIIDIQAAAN